MSMFTLAISCLTPSNLPWFRDLTFQVPMKYCSLQHRTWLPSAVTFTTGCCFCFGSVSSFLLELFLHWSPGAYWAPSDLGSSSFSVLSFLPFHAVHGVLKVRILKWFAIPLSSRPRFVRILHHDHLGWPYTKWPGVSNEPENEGHVPIWSFGPSYVLSPRDHNQDPSGLRRPIFWFPGWTRLRIHSPPL